MLLKIMDNKAPPEQSRHTVLSISLSCLSLWIFSAAITQAEPSLVMKETDCALLTLFSTVPRIFITHTWPGSPEGCVPGNEVSEGLETDVPEKASRIFSSSQRMADIPLDPSGRGRHGASAASEDAADAGIYSGSGSITVIREGLISSALSPNPFPAPLLLPACADKGPEPG